MRDKPLDQHVTKPSSDCIEVLHEISTVLGARVNKTRVTLKDGSVLTHKIRALYREHQIELLANQELMLADLEARYGQFRLFAINPNARLGINFEPTGRTLTAHGRGYGVCGYQANLSRPQADLIESGALERILEAISPKDGEEINISQELVRVFLQRPTRQRVMAVIHAVIDLMPHEPGREALYALEELPVSLRPLIPLLTKWAISDDEDRSRKLKRCAQSTRQSLVNKVVPLIPAIDQFLDTFGGNPTEQACALGDLAQAALEAQSLLAKRNPA